MITIEIREESTAIAIALNINHQHTLLSAMLATIGTPQEANIAKDVLCVKEGSISV